MTHEDQTAKKVIDILQRGVTLLDAETTGKLASARSRALEAARPARAIHNAPAHATMGNYIVSHLPGPRARLAGAFVVVLALLSVLVMQYDHSSTKVETDTLLLASELPPEAYADQGFHAWLKNTSQL